MKKQFEKEKNYSIKDYERDVKNAFEEYNSIILLGTLSDYGPKPLSSSHAGELTGRARGVKNQLISAAGKRLRLAIALQMLDYFDSEFDMTTTLARRITEKLLGRGISRKILNTRYATTGRTAKNKSADFEKLESIHENKVFINTKIRLAMVLDEASLIRRELTAKDSTDRTASELLKAARAEYEREPGRSGVLLL